MLVLVGGLPADAALREHERKGWSQEHELLTTIAEQVDAWGRRGVAETINQGLMKKEHKREALKGLGQPLRIEHPGRPGTQSGEGRRRRRPSSPAEIKKLMSKL